MPSGDGMGLESYLDVSGGVTPFYVCLFVR